MIFPYILLPWHLKGYAFKRHEATEKWNLRVFHSSGNKTSWKTKILLAGQTDSQQVKQKQYQVIAISKPPFFSSTDIQLPSNLNFSAYKDCISACKCRTVQCPIIFKVNWSRRLVLKMGLDLTSIILTSKHSTWKRTLHTVINVTDN